MANNGLSINNANCDLEISSGNDVYGYLCAAGQPIQEARGNGFTGSVGSGAPTYQQATPYSITAWEDFNGGFGQVLQNRVVGGTGAGGNQASYFYGNAWSLKGNILLPGMARNLINPSASTSGVTDEYEVPRGVLPSSHPLGAYGQFTLTSSVTFRKVRILVKFDRPTATSVTITGTVNGLTYTSAAISNLDQYTYFKWVDLDSGSNHTLTAGTYTVTINSNSVDGVIYGCFAGDLTISGTSYPNVIQPYFQIVKTTTGDSYRAWAKSAQRFEQLENSGTYLTVAITDSSLINVTDTTKTELNLSGTVTGFIKFDNQLYVGNGAKTTVFTAAQLSTLSAGTDTSVLVLGPSTTHEGKIYYVDGTTKRKIYKWTGKTPATGADAPTLIIDSDQVGQTSLNGKNNINAITIHKGLLYVFKPEGVYLIYTDPSKIGRQVGSPPAPEVPRVVQVVNLDEQQHKDNGRYVVEMQGALYFNVRNLVYMLNVSEQGNQVSVLVPPFPIGRFLSNNYVNGLTTDGNGTLYCGYNNIGVVAQNMGTYHPVADSYKLITTESVPSGLRYIINPTSAPDHLYFSDGNELVQVPIPSFTSSYSTQLYQSDQNKAFFFVTSVWDADMANLKKYVRDVSIYAAPNGWRFKVVGATWQSGNPNYRTIVEKAINEGLHRDDWLTPNAPTGSYPQIATKMWNNPGVSAPACFDSSEFQTATGIVKKACSTNDVDNPVQTVRMAFVIYGWQSTGQQYSTTYRLQDITYLESFYLNYLPTQEFVSVYQTTLDLSKLLTENAGSLTVYTLEQTVEYLEQRAASETPTRFKFYTGLTEDAVTIGLNRTQVVQTVIGYIQNLHIQRLPQRTADTTQDTLYMQASFTILSLRAKYNFLG